MNSGASRSSLSGDVKVGGSQLAALPSLAVAFGRVSPRLELGGAGSDQPLSRIN